jgi:hypothetical protein
VPARQKASKSGHPVFVTVLLLAIVVVVFFTLGYVLARVLI